MSPYAQRDKRRLQLRLARTFARELLDAGHVAHDPATVVAIVLRTGLEAAEVRKILREIVA